MLSGLTREIGGFAAELAPGSVPDAAKDVVCTGFTDCIGVMIAGRDAPEVGLVEQVILVGQSGGRSSICFGGKRSDAVAAATINGTAAHVLDYDDVAMRGHVSAVLVPAILAEAEQLGASGADMVTAYVAGYESWGELGSRLPQPLHLKGWHPTSVLGTVAAAAACANLRKLNTEKAAHAVGLAASQAAGLTANFGSSAKPFHVGRAAAAGIVSARLADAGATASDDVLENERGFLTAFSADGSADRSSPADRLGVEWRILSSRLNVKRYPVCYAIHRAIDAILDLKQKHNFAADDIALIELRIGSIQAAMLRVDWPRSALEAKFSAKFCVAAAATAGQLGLAQLTAASVAESGLRALADRISIMTTDEKDPAFPNYAPYDQLCVRLRDGSELQSDPVHRARGHADAPLSSGELRDKFVDCVRDALNEAQQDALFAALRDLPALPDAAGLCAVTASDAVRSFDRDDVPSRVPANQNTSLAMGGDRS